MGAPFLTNKMRKPEDELTDLKQRGLLRGLRPISNPDLPTVELQGRKLINFSSNDYLGLSQHPILIEAATKALRDYGTSSTASRLICGSLEIFHQLEEKIATLKTFLNSRWALILEGSLSKELWQSDAAALLPFDDFARKCDTFFAGTFWHSKGWWAFCH